MIWLYSSFRGAFQTCLCKGTSVQAGQLSKFAHISGCPNSYVAILPPKLQMTRKFMRENSSYLTATRGQFSTATANMSNAFSSSPLLRLTHGKRHKTWKILALMQTSVKDCSFQQNWGFRPYLQATWPSCHHQKRLLVFSQQPGKKRRGFVCFQLQQSTNWERIWNLCCPRHLMRQGRCHLLLFINRRNTFIFPLGPGAFPPCTSLTLAVRGHTCFAEHQLCSSESWCHQKWLN